MKLLFIFILFATNTCEIYHIDDYCKVEEYYNDDGYQRRVCYK